MRLTVCRGRNDDGRLCLNQTSDPSRYCEEHRGKGFGAWYGPRTTSDAIYHTRAWRKLRKQVISAWVAEHGLVCPGWRKPPHPTMTFAVDHIVPLFAGGAPMDRANLRALCKSCNSRKSLHDRQQKR